MTTKKKTTAKTRAKAPAKSKAAKPKKERKPGALDAAAKLLATSKEPLTTNELIDAMAAKGLWKSPGGKTPDRTLYSAILREIVTKGKDARFVKSARGKFTLRKGA
jgi:HB1, ASXL, restriction endonuclease HTH domain